MENLILEGFEAIKEIIRTMTDAEANIAKADELRTELNKHTKAELIEMMVSQQVKATSKEPTQKDLLLAVFKEPRCRALDYNEVSACILENMNTKLKYSPTNISWYRSQFLTDGEELVARMTTTERRALDRKIAMTLLGK